MAYLTEAELRGFDDGLFPPETYSSEQIATAIANAEVEVERIIGTAFNSRTATNEWHMGDGSQWLRLDNRWPTSVSAASIDGTALSADALSGLVVNRTTGMVRYSAGWTCEADVLVTYTYGKTAPPADLKEAVMLLVRARLGRTRNPIPDRAERFVSEGGNTFVLSTPSATRTGVPDVDAVLARYMVPGVA